MLGYLKNMEWKLTDMFSTPSVVRKINNANYKGYVNEKLNEEIKSGNTCLAEAILASFKLKRLEKIKTEEPPGGNEVKIVDLSDMTPLEGDEVKSEQEETIAERVKLNPRKRENSNRIKNLEIPVLLAQKKAGNNSYKLKNQMYLLLYLSYQHNKITKIFYNNLIKSL